MKDIRLKKAAIVLNGLVTVLFSCYGLFYISGLYGPLFKLLIIIFSLPLLIWGAFNIYVALNSKYDDYM